MLKGIFAGLSSLFAKLSWRFVVHLFWIVKFSSILPLIGIHTGSIIVLRAIHNRVYAMKNVYSLTHSNSEGHICRPLFIVCQIIVAFCRPFVLDSKVVIQQRYVQMTCVELINSTIKRIVMNMNIYNPLISLQQPDFSWQTSLPTH